MFEFKRILESKVDINLKIAKILTNAMNWKIDFAAFKGCKYTVTLPITRDAAMHTDRNHEETKSHHHTTSNAITNNNLITIKNVEDEAADDLEPIDD